MSGTTSFQLKTVIYVNGSLHTSIDIPFTFITVLLPILLPLLLLIRSSISVLNIVYNFHIASTFPVCHIVLDWHNVFPETTFQRYGSLATRLPRMIHLAGVAPLKEADVLFLSHSALVHRSYNMTYKFLSNLFTMKYTALY